MKTDVQIQISVSRRLAGSWVISASLVGAAGCKSDKAEGEKAAASGDSRAALEQQAPGAGVIAIDGSSTVYPISEAVAEEFKAKSSARVTIGVSGTGGGFEKFCNAETAVTGASRPIKETEVEACKAKGVEYLELPIAYDGIAVVVNPANDWVQHMTVNELRTLWRPEAQGELERWSQIRTGWPEREIHLFGAGVDSGTYDYFTAAIVGKEHSSRGDFTSSEDDNVLVQGVAMDRLALGFFGYAYYVENQAKLKLVAIDDENDGNGKGPIAVSPATVTDGTYAPLSRPIFVYVSKSAAGRPEVDAFVKFYVQNSPKLVSEVGYIPLPASTYELVRQRYEARVAGSLFGGEGSQVGASVESMLRGK